jgi:ABC-type multidrug transport system fused ATPase/permease subunit
MITHRLNTIRHAETIIVLHNGVVVEQGTHEALIALDGIYTGLSRAASEPGGPMGADRSWRAR